MKKFLATFCLLTTSICVCLAQNPVSDAVRREGERRMVREREQGIRDERNAALDRLEAAPTQMRVSPEDRRRAEQEAERQFQLTARDRKLAIDAFLRLSENDRRIVTVEITKVLEKEKVERLAKEKADKIAAIKAKNRRK